MNKNQQLDYAVKQGEQNLEAQRIAARARCVDTYAGLVGTLIQGLTFVGCVYFFMQGMQAILAGRDAESIGAFARIVEALNLGTVVGYVWGIGATTLYVRERKGKKRAIHQKAHLQDQLEAGDPNRTPSGLDSNGHTPRQGR
jgi:hypothetical protein